MKHYFAVFTPEPDGMFSIWFPDIPEIATCGTDIDNAMDMAADALKTMAQAYVREGRSFPEPSSLADVKKANDAFCARHGVSGETSFYPLIPAPNTDRTTVHLSLSMPKFAVEALDRKAKLAGMTRSGYVQAMAMS
ncbi:MAG: type II toxin-antitoxin system HicB family antitoxin [Desulfovibrionaceae bacterium]|nr:type II toxin-antitoxin system HicB family antitoxin [Desulfovibrionaceae bacterium]MBO4793427.1 type II toxin-antitoxin system HicB family antitoxin [Deltaproteobacteria bacterium]